MNKKIIFGIVILFSIAGVLASEYCPQIEAGNEYNETIHFTDSGGDEVNTGLCNLTVYYPNSTIWKENINCTKRALDTHGWYDCNLTVYQPYGKYETSAVCISGLDEGTSSGCFESVAQDDRGYISDLINPLGLLIVAGTLIYLGLNIKGNYGKYISMFFIIFALIWITVGASAIAGTWGENNIDTSVYGEASVALGVYTQWILTVIIVMFFLIFLLYDLGYIALRR